MAKARIEILNEVPDKQENAEEWVLYFQKCIYHYDDGNLDNGFRFIWRKPDGNLQAARGQARIPEPQALYNLIDEAVTRGWFPRNVKS